MSKPQFPLGQAGSNNPRSIFGSASNASSSGPASGSIFGPPTTQAGSIFGASSTSTPGTSAASPFANFGGLRSTSLPVQPTWNFSKPDEGTGSSAPTNSIFQSSSKPETPSVLGGAQPSIFGSTNTATPAFGSTNTSTPAFGKTITSAPSFGFPNTSAPAFGSPNTSAPAFGTTITTTTSTSVPAGSITPATSRSTLFNFASSTTPAGPPPAADANTGAKAPTTVPSVFSGQKPTGTTQLASPTQQSGVLFGTNTASGSSNLFGSLKAPTTNSGSIFSNLSNSKPMSSTSTETSNSAVSASKPAFSILPQVTASSQPATTASSPFGFNAAPSMNSTLLPATAPPQATSIFSNQATKTTQAQTTDTVGGTQTAVTSTQPTTVFGGANPVGSSTNLFAGLGKPTSNTITPPTTSSSPPATTSAPTQPPNVFGSFYKPSGLATSTPANSLAGTTAATTSAIATPSIFGNIGKTQGTIAATTAPSTAPTAAPGTTSLASGLGASTSAPQGTSTAATAQLSRLKNKTIDEIITRWAGDLSNYQKEFQEQAAKVASWDRLLVENGEKIQKLYNSTFEAERASAAVERQLTDVESQQDELSAWLTRFEQDVDRLMADQIGQGETLQGPDQERERTYKLAEKLAERLDEMGKDLTNMIEEINSASASLTKTSQPEDPLSQIVKVLNGHLSQLQWIDQNASAFQAKIIEAQKVRQGPSTNGQIENDAVDSFYRSYIGKR